MSADIWRNCPSCGEENGVGIYGIYDIELTETGKILNPNVEGTCFKCKKRFEGVRGE